MSGDSCCDHAAIRELLAAYALALDADDVDECLEFFTADAEFLVYGRTFAGHDGIGGMFREAPRGLHLTGASRIDIRGDAATVRSQVLFVNASSLQLRSALYDDEAVRQDGRWRFQRRRCRFITSGGLSDSPEVPSL
jgi:ketosteroid isomerase-like protein